MCAIGYTARAMGRVDAFRCRLQRAATALRTGVAAVVCSIMLACAHSPATGPPPPAAEARPRTEPAAVIDVEQAIRRDPVAYLRRVRDRCAALDQYTVTLVRQERRGLVPALQDPEHIAAWFRQQPFSVRFKWLDPDIKYGESTYVEGRYDGLVRFVPRFGLFGLPPTEVRVTLATPVFWGEAKRPVTDFGMLRTMELTLDTLEADGAACHVTVVGLVSNATDGRPARLIRVEYPPGRHAAPVQELLIDAHSDLLRATRLYLADGGLDASYEYRDLDASVRLSDDDFLLEAERRGCTSQPAAATEARARVGS